MNLLRTRACKSGAEYSEGIGQTPVQCVLDSNRSLEKYLDAASECRLELIEFQEG